MFGNYTARNDGPGKVFDFAGVQNMTIENIWVEHMMCLFWGNNVDNNVIRDSRVRNMYADGLNLTNGSAGNRVANIEARSTGDDAFALFAATDGGGGGPAEQRLREPLGADPLARGRSRGLRRQAQHLPQHLRRRHAHLLRR